MIRRQGGFTVIEVMIVLAVSSVIFVGAVSSFSNSRRGVEFSQAVYDLQSNIKVYVSQVNSGVLPGDTDTDPGCQQDPATRRPALGSTSGTGECIFLGKVLKPIPGTDQIISYDVLGLRNIHDGLTDTGDPIQTVVEGMPEPVGTISGGNYLMSNPGIYSLQNGATVVSAKSNGNDANILKIYSTLQNNNTTSRGVTAYAGNYPATSGESLTSDALKQCIEELGGTPCAAKIPLEINGWDLCLKNDAGDRFAILTIKPGSTGIATKINFTACS